MLRKISNDKPLKIIGFTDTHIDDYAERLEVTLKMIQEAVKTEQPDLVVFVGDNVTGGDNRARAERFQQMMTDLQVPWAPVLGNHEGDNPMSVLRSEMVDIFRKSPYCLIPAEKPVLANGTPVYGDTNYILNLENEAGEVVRKFYMIDCGPDTTKEDLLRFGIIIEKKNPDGYLKPSQIAWYKDNVKNDTCKSTIFCHIALHEAREAMQKGEHVWGVNAEGICTSPYNSGMFAAIEEAGKTDMFVVGHDHVNTGRYLYKDVLFMYNHMSGMSSYNWVSTKRSEKHLQGYTLYYVDAEGKVTMDDVVYADKYPEHYEDIHKNARSV